MCDARQHPEYLAMLATLTATQARCTEQEQELRELRGKQGAIECSTGPYVSGWLDDVSQHDTEEQAREAAKKRTASHPSSGEAFAGQVMFTQWVIPAQAERIEEDDFTGPL